MPIKTGHRNFFFFKWGNVFNMATRFRRSREVVILTNPLDVTWFTFTHRRTWCMGGTRVSIKWNWRVITGEGDVIFFEGKICVVPSFIPSKGWELLLMRFVPLNINCCENSSLFVGPSKRSKRILLGFFKRLRWQTNKVGPQKPKQPIKSSHYLLPFSA